MSSKGNKKGLPSINSRHGGERLIEYSMVVVTEIKRLSLHIEPYTHDS
jgi:hypothetical protein